MARTVARTPVGCPGRAGRGAGAWLLGSCPLPAEESARRVQLVQVPDCTAQLGRGSIDTRLGATGAGSRARVAQRGEQCVGAVLGRGAAASRTH